VDVTAADVDAWRHSVAHATAGLPLGGCKQPSSSSSSSSFVMAHRDVPGQRQAFLAGGSPMGLDSSASTGDGFQGAAGTASERLGVAQQAPSAAGATRSLVGSRTGDAGDADSVFQPSRPGSPLAAGQPGTRVLVVPASLAASVGVAAVSSGRGGGLQAGDEAGSSVVAHGSAGSRSAASCLSGRADGSAQSRGHNLTERTAAAPSSVGGPPPLRPDSYPHQAESESEWAVSAALEAASAASRIGRVSSRTSLSAMDTRHAGLVSTELSGQATPKPSSASASASSLSVAVSPPSSSVGRASLSSALPPPPQKHSLGAAGPTASNPASSAPQQPSLSSQPRGKGSAFVGVGLARPRSGSHAGPGGGGGGGGGIGTFPSVPVPSHHRKSGRSRAGSSATETAAFGDSAVALAAAAVTSDDSLSHLQRTLHDSDGEDDSDEAPEATQPRDGVHGAPAHPEAATRRRRPGGGHVRSLSGDSSGGGSSDRLALATAAMVASATGLTNPAAIGLGMHMSPGVLDSLANEAGPQAGAPTGLTPSHRERARSGSFQAEEMALLDAERELARSHPSGMFGTRRM
jgi:hypothetical protein